MPVSVTETKLGESELLLPEEMNSLNFLSIYEKKSSVENFQFIEIKIYLEANTSDHTTHFINDKVFSFIVTFTCYNKLYKMQNTVVKVKILIEKKQENSVTMQCWIWTERASAREK